jgi:hypothetical protein
MPAKGRYFLNEGEEGLDQATLYEKYRLTSQHGPLLLVLLVVAVAACIALIAITFSHGVSSWAALDSHRLRHSTGELGQAWSS